MRSKITQQEIGKKIATLRKNKGLSQEDLAKRVGISRPSLTQVELGNRNLSAIELHTFSMELNFSIDTFLGAKIDSGESLQSNMVEEPREEYRVSVAKLDVGKLRNILLYILEKCAANPNVEEALLHKLMYFSDFNYYELYEEHLTGATYRKLPYGPVPQKFDSILNNMLEEGEVQRVKTEYQGQPQTKYLPLKKSDLTKLKASETDVIDKVIDRYSNWSAKAIRDYAHNDMPWQATKDGKDINYELVFYREAPYSVRVYHEEGQDDF